MSAESTWLVDIGIPAISVAALLAVTLYISADAGRPNSKLIICEIIILFCAVKVLYHPPTSNDVDMYYLYGFSSANMVVDLVSAAAILNRGNNAFYEEKDEVI